MVGIDSIPSTHSPTVIQESGILHSLTLDVLVTLSLNIVPAK